MCLALKQYCFEAFHRFALTPSPLSPRGEGETTITARERHFFVCQIAKQVLRGEKLNRVQRFIEGCVCKVQSLGFREHTPDQFAERS